MDLSRLRGTSAVRWTCYYRRGLTWRIRLDHAGAPRRRAAPSAPLAVTVLAPMTKEDHGMTTLRDPDGLPAHWWRSATHYERQPWRPRVMVLYELRAAGPRRYAYAIEAERSLGVYPSAGEAIAAVEAELARRARRPRPPRARSPRRATVADSRQFDLFTLPIVAPGADRNRSRAGPGHPTRSPERP
jgi:hypothetical protein